MNPLTQLIVITLVSVACIAVITAMVYIGLRVLRSLDVGTPTNYLPRDPAPMWSSTTYGAPTRVVVVSDADGIDRIYADTPELVVIVDVYDAGDTSGPEAAESDVLPMSKLPGWVSNTLADADLAGWPSTRKTSEDDEP